MIKIIKRGTKRTIQCEMCGCLFSFEEEDIFHKEACRFNEIENVPGTKEGFKTYVTCPQCQNEVPVERKVMR